MKQSSGAFLQKAGEAQASEVLLSWALDQHQRGESSFSELSEETGLSVEELMTAAENIDSDTALDVFLNGCRALAEATDDAEFLRLSEQAVDSVRKELAEG